MTTVDTGHDVPCMSGDRDLWIADDDEPQRRAARLCQGCPVMDACRAYALDASEPAGVWGGLTENVRRSRRIATTRFTNREAVKIMSSTENTRVARLEAIAAVRSVVTEDPAGLEAVLDGTEDLRELAHALASLAASLLVGLVRPDERRLHILDGWTEAAIGEEESA
jgi:hypothetical protein